LVSLFYHFSTIFARFCKLLAKRKGEIMNMIGPNLARADPTPLRTRAHPRMGFCAKVPDDSNNRRWARNTILLTQWHLHLNPLFLFLHNLRSLTTTTRSPADHPSPELADDDQDQRNQVHVGHLFSNTVDQEQGNTIVNYYGPSSSEALSPNGNNAHQTKVKKDTPSSFNMWMKM
jgi:hypothetical protein